MTDFLQYIIVIFLIVHCTQSLNAARDPALSHSPPKVSTSVCLTHLQAMDKQHHMQMDLIS